MKRRGSTLEKKAWKVFSEYIRKRDGRCFTCGARKELKELDAGHFYHGKLDFDEMNIHAQCTKCNRFLHGNLGEYAIRLIDTYGREAFDELGKRRWAVNKWDFNTIIDEYTKKISEL